MSAIYAARSGVSPKAGILHACLECGIIGRRYPALEMISFGPTIRYPHSLQERVDIASVGKFWDFLLKLLDTLFS